MFWALTLNEKHSLKYTCLKLVSKLFLCIASCVAEKFRSSATRSRASPVFWSFHVPSTLFVLCQKTNFVGFFSVVKRLQKLICGTCLCMYTFQNTLQFRYQEQDPLSYTNERPANIFGKHNLRRHNP